MSKGRVFSKFRTALFIAWRHLFSKKKHSLVNIIAIVSALGVMSGAAALVIVLSVYNGLEDLVTDSFNDFNPDFKITAKTGKSFAVDSFPTARLQAVNGVKSVEEVISDLVLIEYGEKQHLIEVKGVNESYVAHLTQRSDSLLIDGSFEFQGGAAVSDETEGVIGEDCDYAVIGSRTAVMLGINLNSYELIKLYYPQRKHKALAREKDLIKRYLVPGGVFESRTEYDERFLFCSIDFARSLMSYEGEATAMEVFLDHPEQMERVQKELKAIVGDQFIVENRYEQEAMLFKTMKTEKFVIYIILAFILMIAIFNIIGTLAMIIIEKREDTLVMNYLGASRSLIRWVFMLEGMIISFLGGVVGMCLGWLVCILQQTFHLITIGDGTGSYIINYYPVRMDPVDFLFVFATVFVTSLLVSFLPTRRLNPKTTEQP